MQQVFAHTILLLFTDSKLRLYFPGLFVQITEQKTGNNVSEFTESNWITLSYYSSPKHKSVLHGYLMYFSDFHIQ